MLKRIKPLSKENIIWTNNYYYYTSSFYVWNQSTPVEILLHIDLQIQMFVFEGTSISHILIKNKIFFQFPVLNSIVGKFIF